MARNKRMYVLSLNALSSVLSLLLGFFCTVSCFMVLWPKFVRHFPKDAQNKRRREKQIKGAQSEYGESFST